jgi:hypothetical protein
LRIADIKGKYDDIFSLGELCFISIQLEKNGIRPYSGVLDWVGSPSLSGVNRLLRNRFEGFMDRHQMECIGTAGEKLYLVQDKTYDIYSNHDFFIAQNDPKLLEAYPSVKAKYDRRVARFLEKAGTSERLLFVRSGGTYEEVEQLQQVLDDLVHNDYVLLFINPGRSDGIEENDWPMERVCSVNAPHVDKLWGDSDHLWKELFEGIELRK